MGEDAKSVKATRGVRELVKLRETDVLWQKLVWRRGGKEGQQWELARCGGETAAGP